MDINNESEHNPSSILIKIILSSAQEAGIANKMLPKCITYKTWKLNELYTKENYVYALIFHVA